MLLGLAFLFSILDLTSAFEVEALSAGEVTQLAEDLGRPLDDAALKSLPTELGPGISESLLKSLADSTSEISESLKESLTDVTLNLPDSPVKDVTEITMDLVDKVPSAIDKIPNIFNLLSRFIPKLTSPFGPLMFLYKVSSAIFRDIAKFTIKPLLYWINFFRNTLVPFLQKLPYLWIRLFLRTPIARSSIFGLPIFRNLRRPFVKRSLKM